MVNSISNTPPPPPPNKMQGKDTALSDDQKTLISEILENIDADNLSQEQAVEIAEAFSAAGIVPGKDLAATLAESGFDARKIGDLARNAQRPQAQSTSEQVDLTELVDYLDTLLEQFSGSSLSDADKTSVYEGLRERFGLDEGDAIINVTA